MRVTFRDKPLEIELTAAAQQALQARSEPLLAEMELYFSCLIRKQVRFRAPGDREGTAVHEQLRVAFRPVMSEHCRVADAGDAPPPLTDFPLVNDQAYTPRWLRIDYRGGHWVGEFGYHRS